MANRIVLISDDSDFYDYVRTKLELRKSDELFTFSFDDVPEKLHMLLTAVLIINSENNQQKTIDLLKLVKGTPSIVSAYNEDDVFKRKCYRAGMFDYITILTPDSEFRARMIPALNAASILEKNRLYREILAKNKIIAKNNEVFTDYESIIDDSLQTLAETRQKAVFAAVSPNEKSKFLLQPNLIETIILNNIRKNDILMNYAPNKYFMLLFDTDTDSVEKLWDKISSQMPQKIYAGFVSITNQKRQQLIDLALNKLHDSINKEKDYTNNKTSQINGLNTITNDRQGYANFKIFKQEFGHKIEKIITPVFYQIQQKYSGKLMGVTLEQGSGDGYGTFYIKSKHSTSCFRITSPGFSKINIDITYTKGSDTVDAKRITLEPEELEKGLLEDLLEQFITEYKNSAGVNG